MKLFEICVCGCYSASESVLHFWVERLDLDAADALAVFDLESHVAFFAPTGSPGVLHDPVFGTVLRPVPDKEGCVVKSVTATAGIEDAALVLLEHRFVSFK